jgi:hypothetical protein
LPADILERWFDCPEHRSFYLSSSEDCCWCCGVLGAGYARGAHTQEFQKLVSFSNLQLPMAIDGKSGEAG